jgi:hypothetical protein
MPAWFRVCIKRNIAKTKIERDVNKIRTITGNIERIKATSLKRNSAKILK